MKVMKKICSVILAMFIFFSVSAQIPNGGFEEWKNDSTLDNWNGLLSVDVIITQYEFNTVTKTTDAYSGDFAALITSSKTIPYINLLLPGVMSYGTNNVVLNLTTFNLETSITGGLPVSVIPTKVKGFYKYAGVNGDSMSVGAECYYSTVLIASGLFMNNSLEGGYVPFEFDLTYSEAEVPDMINIFAKSSAGDNPQLGSALYIDDVSIEYTAAGITETVSLDELSLYPNPTTGLLSIKLNPNETNNINIFDYSGKLICSVSSDNYYITLDMRSFANGAYFVEVNNSSGRLMSKFILAR